MTHGVKWEFFCFVMTQFRLGFIVNRACCNKACKQFCRFLFTAGNQKYLEITQKQAINEPSDKRFVCNGKNKDKMLVRFCHDKFPFATKHYRNGRRKPQNCLQVLLELVQKMTHGVKWSNRLVTAPRTLNTKADSLGGARDLKQRYHVGPPARQWGLLRALRACTRKKNLATNEEQRNSDRNNVKF